MVACDMNKREMIDLITGKDIKTCLVASIDIMGFSFLARVRPCMSMILLNMKLRRTVRNARKRFPQFLFGKKALVRTIRNNTKIVQFSDTLVFFLPIRDGISIEVLSSFCGAISFVVKELFDEGFPSQACIHFGRCLYNEKENYFIGEPFIAAHQTAEMLGFSGLVVPEEVVRRATGSLRNDVARNLLGKSICVPCKRSNSLLRYKKASFYCVDWMHFWLDESRKGWGFARIEKYVASRFAANGKTIEDHNVRKKMNNTIELMKTFLSSAKNEVYRPQFI